MVKPILNTAYHWPVSYLCELKMTFHCLTHGLSKMTAILQSQGTVARGKQLNWLANCCLLKSHHINHKINFWIDGVNVYLINLSRLVLLRANETKITRMSWTNKEKLTLLPLTRQTQGWRKTKKTKEPRDPYQTKPQKELAKQRKHHENLHRGIPP